MAKRQPIADVIVGREWWTNTAAKLLTPYPMRATAQFHRVRGPLVSQDHHGIWLGQAPSNLVHGKDKSQTPVLVELFIPWGRIDALALISDPSAVKPGFRVSEVIGDPQGTPGHNQKPPPGDPTT